jgi:hypothetical protein
MIFWLFNKIQESILIFSSFFIDKTKNNSYAKSKKNIVLIFELEKRINNRFQESLISLSI